MHENANRTTNHSLFLECGLLRWISKLEELSFILKQEFELNSTLNAQKIFKELLETVHMGLILSVVCKVDLDIK